MPEPKSQIWPGIHVQFAAFRSSIISTSKKLQAKKGLQPYPTLLNQVGFTCLPPLGI